LCGCNAHSNGKAALEMALDSSRNILIIWLKYKISGNLLAACSVTGAGLNGSD
jgi:hypothetical protein